jgi:hypothetical protein
MIWGKIKKVAKVAAPIAGKVAVGVAKETGKTVANTAVKGANIVKDQTVSAATNVAEGAEKMGTSIAKGDIKGVAEGAMQVKKGADMVNPKAIVTNKVIDEVKKKV